MRKMVSALLMATAVISFAGCAEAATGNTVAGQAEAPARASQIVIEGTNSLEDATRINAAIAASPEGSEVLFRGRFLINETIRLLGNRSYRGESRAGTVLQQADGANLDALVVTSGFRDNKPWTGQPVSVSHLQLDGNRRHNTQSETTGLVLRAWLSIVEDMHIKDMGGDGLRLTNRSADGTGLDTSQVNGRISNSFIERSGRHGIFVEDSQNRVTDWILSDNWIAGTGMDGIHLGNAAGWYVVRNHIYGVSQNAIYAKRLFGTSITDNYIEGFGEKDSKGVWYGIYGTLQGSVASTIARNRIFNVHGAQREGSGNRYLALTVNAGTAMAVVTGNAIRGAGTPSGTGLYFAAPGKRKLILTSTGNAVENVATKRLLDGDVTLSSGL
ncbi:right-handed parallel beta-helix repeat-containing protein [Marinobacterium aestuariivivens]|uniref:Right-handed parallel beta-helix repeat-containing protein n=1 Tax=Marinobacterium aestuariivivens TaxID=1698799 RepID=A0ABW1ZZA3_9GAMM